MRNCLLLCCCDIDDRVFPSLFPKLGPGNDIGTEALEQSDVALVNSLFWQTLKPKQRVLYCTNRRASHKPSIHGDSVKMAKGSNWLLTEEADLNVRLMVLNGGRAGVDDGPRLERVAHSVSSWYLD